MRRAIGIARGNPGAPFGCRRAGRGGASALAWAEGPAREHAPGRAMGIARGNPDAPFGCVIADTGSGEILSEGLIDAQKSPTLHGETAALGVLSGRRPGAGA